MTKLLQNVLDKLTFHDAMNKQVSQYKLFYCTQVQVGGKYVFPLRFPTLYMTSHTPSQI